MQNWLQIHKLVIEMLFSNIVIISITKWYYYSHEDIRFFGGKGCDTIIVKKIPPYKFEEVRVIRKNDIVVNNCKYYWYSI